MKSDISGFPEFLPQEQIVFSEIMEIIKKKFEFYGFVPMDTPAVERVSTLLAKGDDNEIYGLYRLADGENAKKDLGLRFDLTVPLARYVAAHFGQLVFPYKRYHIAPVWRGERPQYGRYRQFYQCDVDVVGNGELSLAHDAEIILLVTDVLQSLNIFNFHTKINNRKILSGFLKTFADEKTVTEIIKLIDKIGKISYDEFDEAVLQQKVSDNDLRKIRSFLEIEKRGRNLEVLKWMETLKFNEEYSLGVSELEETLQLLKKMEIEDNKIKISMKLARGLTYYTGNVFETVLDDFDDLGSIAGGGRYDNLVRSLSDKYFPGVGVTIGISRLVPKLLEKGLLKADRSATAQLLVTVQCREYMGSYLKMADKLRSIGIKTEIYLHDKNLGAQLSYASKKGIKFVLIANEMELLDGRAIIRNLETKEQMTISVPTFAEEISKFMEPQ
ncbi:MAG: histidine--tRNA ligase [Holosporaceae bacterium]|jgi:histidyl-tRNA synthetase|nr:histidine--tRNA ligase [Holosporaceae bacterium]